MSILPSVVEGTDMLVDGVTEDDEIYPGVVTEDKPSICEYAVNTKLTA